MSTKQSNKATSQEILEARTRTAMTNPEHLERWLLASGREYLCFVTRDLIEALRPYWPEAHRELQDVIALYLNKRMQEPTGDVRKEKSPVTGDVVEAPIMKSDAMTKEELDRMIRWAIGQITRLDQNWSLEDRPL